MADIEAKLNMSLDDLVKNEKTKEPQQHQRGWHGPDRSHNRGGGGRSGQRMQGGGGGRSGGQQQRAQYQGFRHNPQAAAALQYVQEQQWDGPQMPMQMQMQQQWGGGPPMQQQWGPPQQQQQQQWGGSGGRGAGGIPYDPNRKSVFGRLSGVAQPGGRPAAAQQQQQQPAAPPRKAPKVQCRVDTESGDVVISHSSNDIIRVSKSGDVVLSSNGHHDQQTLDAFNCVLSHLSMSVKAVSGDPSSGQWSVSDGKRLLRFSDGMKIPSRGPVTAGRAMVLMQAYAAGPSKAAAAAAEEASKQAAIAAGLLPADAAAGGADGMETDEAARLRRLKAQGRFQPY